MSTTQRKHAHWRSRSAIGKSAIAAAAASVLTMVAAAPSFAQSRWSDDYDQYRYRNSDPSYYPNRFSSRDDYWHDRYARERGPRYREDSRWRDARGFDYPYRDREWDRLRWGEYDSMMPDRRDHYSRGGEQYRPRYRTREMDERGLPSYPRDFYAGRGPEQFQGRQYMPPGFDYYDFYGAERPANRPDERQARRGGRQWERQWDDARMRDHARADRWREDRWPDRQQLDRSWDRRGDRWAYDRRDWYDGRYDLPRYEGDFTGSTGVGMGDMTGRGVGLPDYYQGERGGPFHRGMAQGAERQRDEGAPARQQGASQAQESTRRGGPPVARAEAGTDRQPQSASEQPDIPGQSMTTVGHPDKAQTTGQGQGVIEQNTDVVKQPEAQIPEQSLSTVGHPGKADTTGQGSGVAEQPEANQGQQTGNQTQQPGNEAQE